MEIIYLLIPGTLLLGAGALCAYLWAVRSGQFDDLDTPAQRVLFDDLPSHENRQDGADDAANTRVELSKNLQARK